MNKVCILGIDGFTGRHLQEYIHTHNLTQNFEFFGYSRTPVTGGDFPTTVLESTNRNALAAALTKLKPHYIINLIGSPKVDTVDQAIALNASISQWICEIVLENKIPIKNLLAIGSATEYGQAQNLPIQESHPTLPESYYGLAKSWQTQLLTYFNKKEQLPVSVARTFNIIGQGLPIYLSIGSFAKQIQEAEDGEVIRVGNMETRRDFLAIDDVVAAYWKILTQAPTGNVYNVCSGKSYSVKELLEHLITASGKKITIRSDAKLHRLKDQLDVFGDSTKLQEATDWKPRTDIFETLKLMVKPE